MNLNLVASTLDIIGKVMVAYTALSVHRRVWQEHQIDRAVFAAMKREQVIGVIGIVLMITAYLLDIIKI